MSHSPAKSSPASQGSSFVVVSTSAQTLSFASDEEEVVILHPRRTSSSPRVGTLTPQLEPDSDIVLLGQNGPMKSPPFAGQSPITRSDILVESSDRNLSHECGPRGVAIGNALQLTQAQDDDEVIYDDFHSTLAGGISRLRISSPDISSESGRTNGYQTAGSDGTSSSPPSPPPLTKNQRQRERGRQAKARVRDTEVVETQITEQAQETVTPVKLTKSQKRSAQRKRSQARVAAAGQPGTSPSPSISGSTPARLTKSQKCNARRKRSKARHAAATDQPGTSFQLPSPSIPGPQPSKASKSTLKKHRKSASKNSTFIESSFYLNAVRHMTNHIAAASCPNPPPRNTQQNLKIAQALLVETGAVQDPSKLPASFTQAKSLLKSSVHINILDYLQVRKSGLEAIREVLFKSLQELRRDIRDPSRRAALKKVKKLGLNQLLAI